MARTTTYLNFAGNTEQAFEFYRAVFQTEYSAPISRMGEVPSGPGAPAMSEEDKRAVLHVALPILGGHVLMGTDALESMGHKLVEGNNFALNLQPDTRAETERLFNALSEGATEVMALREQFWGAYFGSLRDKFGVRWMFNCEAKA
ncbi:MAG: VOC family protein [Myxococcales bacterium]|nr:VOC family protein [Myxococcales bacterium]